MKFENDHGALVFRRQGELVRVESWGKDSLRIRATMYPDFTGNDWALTEPAKKGEPVVFIDRRENKASITNGQICVKVNEVGIISIYKNRKGSSASDDSGELILREYYRNYAGTISKESRCLKQTARTYKPYVGGDYKITLRFESTPEEKIFGMGQYQFPNANLKGCVLDLEQRNSQVSVPFCISSKGYGFLWNNPAIGRATFGSNITEWIAEAAKELDYWVSAADTPKGLLANYTAVTGRAPQMPDDLLGLWQCKLRYRTQEEVLSVAHACKDHGVPIDVIVIDFFHWPYQGSWCFDRKYWPDPKAMIDELHRMGIKVCVSVWPSVDKRSEHYQEMEENGLLIRTERGAAQTYDYEGDCVEIDATNPQTREYVWDICKRNYQDLGVDMFWLDNSEPDYVAYDFDHYRYYLGPALECSNIYPQYYSRIFYDHEVAEASSDHSVTESAGQKDLSRDNPGNAAHSGEGAASPVNLLRSAWAGSQKYGNVVWSGDVPSTFEALRDQVSCGLNMGLAGICWWTTDIGGFMTDDVNDPQFGELLIRWYEFAVFTAVLRMHGDRGPYDIPPLDHRDYGGGYLHTGQPNELWSYGEENFRVMKKYLDIRLAMKPYLHQLFAQASQDGSPLVRTMFYEFPDDPECWALYDQAGRTGSSVIQYMFGPSLLVAPVLYYGERQRRVYLPPLPPEEIWQDTRDGSRLEGGQTIIAEAPLDSIPVYRRARRHE